MSRQSSQAPNLKYVVDSSPSYQTRSVQNKPAPEPETPSFHPCQLSTSESYSSITGTWNPVYDVFTPVRQKFQGSFWFQKPYFFWMLLPESLKVEDIGRLFSDAIGTTKFAPCTCGWYDAGSSCPTRKNRCCGQLLTTISKAKPCQIEARPAQDSDRPQAVLASHFLQESPRKTTARLHAFVLSTVVQAKQRASCKVRHEDHLFTEMQTQKSSLVSQTIATVFKRHASICGDLPSTEPPCHHDQLFTIQ